VLVSRVNIGGKDTTAIYKRQEGFKYALVVE